MEDHDVFHDAQEDNARMWELGDVFEVFFRERGQAGYDEVHLTPTNRRMHLRFPSLHTINLVRVGDDHHNRYFVPTDGLITEATVTGEGWRAIVGIPRKNSVGDVLTMSICRYDAHPDRSPTFSSTTPHKTADFHRAGDWLEFELLA